MHPRTRKKLIIVTGLQRSGNHAVINWILSLFSNVLFFNDQPHDLFLCDPKCANLNAKYNEISCLVISFEDSRGRTLSENRVLIEDIAWPEPDMCESREIHRLYVLRDPYNTWASRIAARARVKQGKHGLTSNPSWELFRANWLAIARHQALAPDECILFNCWKTDAKYRRFICAGLDGEYSEETLDQVLGIGGGSSFEGWQRPTFGQIVQRIPRYLSFKFIGSFAGRPGEYLQKLLNPRVRGTQLQVNERWRFLFESEEGCRIFCDDEIRAESLRIFGFAFSRDGTRITAR